MDEEIMNRTHELIDELKATCAAKGLGNDGNEYKVITQVFQYKFLNDKFLKEMRGLLRVPEGESVYDALMALPDEVYARQRRCLPSGIAKFQKNQLIQSLHNQQNVPGFDTLFDQTLSDITAQNAAIFVHAARVLHPRRRYHERRRFARPLHIGKEQSQVPAAK